MGVIADLMNGMRQLLLMQERINAVQQANLRLANAMTEIDRRLIRVETYLELTSRNGGKPSSPQAIDHDQPLPHPRASPASHATLPTGA